MNPPPGFDVRDPHEQRKPPVAQQPFPQAFPQTQPQYQRPMMPQYPPGNHISPFYHTLNQRAVKECLENGVWMNSQIRCVFSTCPWPALLRALFSPSIFILFLFKDMRVCLMECPCGSVCRSIQRATSFPYLPFLCFSLWPFACLIPFESPFFLWNYN